MQKQSPTKKREWENSRLNGGNVKNVSIKKSKQNQANVSLSVSVCILFHQNGELTRYIFCFQSTITEKNYRKKNITMIIFNTLNICEDLFFHCHEHTLTLHHLHNSNSYTQTHWYSFTDSLSGDKEWNQLQINNSDIIWFLCAHIPISEPNR